MDIAGFPCDYNAIMKLVNEPEVKAMFLPETENQRKLGRILVLNDAAHSLGAWYEKGYEPEAKPISPYSHYMPLKT